MLENDYNKDIMFQEIRSGVLQPRIIFIDHDRESVEKLPNIFNKNLILGGNESCSDNFATAVYVKKDFVTNYVLPKIDEVLETCDSCQGFLIFNSICGGTGSGFATLIY